MPSTRRILTTVTAVAVAGLAINAAAATAPRPLRFGAPVELTRFAYCGGYEPGVLVDRFGNIVVTAHKQNHCDAGAYDPQGGTVPARAMSWLWMSTDGVHFKDMPGTTVAGANTSQLDVGDEGHLARDDRGNIYFVDLKVADDTFVSWKATGKGKVTETRHAPLLGTAQAADDRPWVAAHGNGVVLFASNSGSSAVYSSPQNGGSGRYTIYLSYDGGATFDHLGYTIPSSGWCYPTADHRHGSRWLYVTCTDDNGKLFVYASGDDGHHWVTHPIGRYQSLDTWPISAVGPDGTVYMEYVDRNPTTKNYSLTLYRSRNHGRTWEAWKATPQQGRFDDIAGPAWIDVAPNGDIGLDYYLLPPQSTRWHIYAAVTSGWHQRFRIADAGRSTQIGTTTTIPPWGDFLSCAFGPDNKLRVVWTTDAPIQGGPGTTSGVNSDIWFAQQR